MDNIHLRTVSTNGAKEAILGRPAKQRPNSYLGIPVLVNLK